MKRHYQLVIIGAGPAGSYAALTAARAGLDLLLVERDPEVGRPLMCAEGISQVGLTSFIEPDPVFISSEIYNLAFTVSSGYSFRRKDTELLGYVLDRPTFDRFLAETAVKEGAELITGTYAGGIRINESKPAEIDLITAMGSRTVRAEFVIAADGVESMIGRMAGIETSLALSQSESTLQYRVSNIDVDPRGLEFFVGQSYAPGGYLWVFPKSDCEANIGLGQNPAGTDVRELKQRLDSFMAERYPTGKIEFISCGMVPKFIGFDILGRGNLLLAGDAARTIDSLTGAGNARALHTGRLAAEAIVNALKHNRTQSELQNDYRMAVEKGIGRDMRLYQKAYPIFRKFSDDEWETVARLIESYLANRKAGSLDPAALVKSVLLSASGLIKIIRHLF